jgi:uncharacterized protein YbjT (DUF2867 family)
MIPVTGATGNVGSELVAALAERRHPVRALVGDNRDASFPDGVEVVAGDLADPASTRHALEGVSGLPATGLSRDGRRLGHRAGLDPGPPHGVHVQRPALAPRTAARATSSDETTVRSAVYDVTGHEATTFRVWATRTISRFGNATRPSSTQRKDLTCTPATPL